MFYAFIIGLLLAYSYFVNKKKGFSAFWIVFIIHSIRNIVKKADMFLIFSKIFKR